MPHQGIRVSAIDEAGENDPRVLGRAYTGLEVGRIGTSANQDQFLDGADALECRHQVLQSLVRDESPYKKEIILRLEVQTSEDVRALDIGCNFAAKGDEIELLFELLFKDLPDKDVVKDYKIWRMCRDE